MGSDVKVLLVFTGDIIQIHLHLEVNGVLTFTKYKGKKSFHIKEKIIEVYSTNFHMASMSFQT